MDAGGKKDGAVEKLLSVIKRYYLAVAAVLLGAAVLLLPQGSPRETPESDEGKAGFDAETLRREMEAILSSVDGTGRLALMLTFDSGAEQELARDTSLTYDGSAAAPEDYSRRSETVVLGSGASAQVVVTRNVYPRCLGALIVCEGGGDAAVRLELTRAVAALTGLSADRISVVRGTPREKNR